LFFEYGRERSVGREVREKGEERESGNMNANLLSLSPSLSLLFSLLSLSLLFLSPLPLSPLSLLLGTPSPSERDVQLA